MRTRGEIDGVRFTRQQWSIYHLATAYLLYDGEECQTVYVNTMLELKREIANMAGTNEGQTEI